MRHSIRRPLLFAVALSLFAAALRAQEIEPPQPELPDVPISCELPVQTNPGTSISYNVDPQFESPFANSLHTQATNYVRQGTFYAAQRQYLGAERFFTYAIDRLTYLYNLFNARAFTAAREGNTSEAINNFVQAYTVSLNLADVYDRRGLTRVALEDYDGAVDDISAALGFVPNLRVNPSYARAYYQVGNDFAQNSQLDEAIDMYSRALALNPNSNEAYHKRGGIYFKAGNYLASLIDFTCAVEFAPDYAPNYHLRGRAAAALGDYEQAIADYSQALQMNTRNALAYIDRGIVYRQLGDYGKAVTDFTWAAIADPNEPAAYNNRGIAYQELGLYAQALEDYTRAIELDPLNPIYYNNRAWVLRELNNTPAAGVDFVNFFTRLNYQLPQLMIETLGQIVELESAAG